jgi:hypothetical protein
MEVLIFFYNKLQNAIKYRSKSLTNVLYKNNESFKFRHGIIITQVVLRVQFL